MDPYSRRANTCMCTLDQRRATGIPLTSFNHGSKNIFIWVALPAGSGVRTQIIPDRDEHPRYKFAGGRSDLNTVIWVWEGY